ncbi:hypothetical protein E8E12_002684 [Didymella heteroderae]|uniref:Enoyl reductase (ER) domain-containing protein n=1 Tax=Didymella heteroderae TaxID=1769908 RepID=A0A9P4WN98_9PLEO|nr:hypothetical protein E8E12_002684 [Didymella heteroderae]
MCLSFLTLTSAASSNILPGVPKLKGYPILGAIPVYFRDGMALMLETLTSLGDEGISYAQVGNKTLVSVHDPVMAKEVLGFTDKIASRSEESPYDLIEARLIRSRLGDPRVFSWSPFWTLIRLLDNNLFDDVGHEAMRQRGVFIKEFNNPLSNIDKFDGVMRVAIAHVKAIAGDADKAVIPDIRHAADSFAATLWGDTLYGRSDALTDGRVMKVADEILRRAGSPWPSASYSLMLTLGLVEPGKPTPSEAKVRAEIEDLYEKNVQHLEDYERNNPDSSMKTIRSLSVADGGKRTGPLTSIGSNITWTLIELQKRPDVLTKLLSEIESVDEVSFTTITTKMPYLNAIIMEINRLYPSVPATLRVIEREARLATANQPVILKPGMMVYLSYLHMHTSPKYWGPTASKFDPDRFLGGIDKSKPFMAFGSGTRDCVGYKFALLAVKVYLITLLKTYTFKVEENNCTPKLNTLLETSGPYIAHLVNAPGWTDVDLGSIPCAFSTAENMVHRSHVQKGETVVITGVSGGVGAAAVQLCKRRGARVIAVAGKHKGQRMLDVGADEVIARGESVSGSLSMMSVEVVLDVVAELSFTDLLDVLKKGGRYATAGAIAGPIVELDIRTLYLKDLSFFGCTLQDEEVFGNLVKYIEKGEIKRHVGEVFKLKDIGTAQEVFQSKESSGKFVLKVK